MKILIADDSPTQAAFLKRALRGRGHEVVVAKDGIEAIEAAYREAPDLIVSDIIMPRLNGYQVCRFLKDDQSMAGTPIILLTSLDQKADMFWGVKSGADLFLTKRNDLDSLVADIERFLHDHPPAAREKSEESGAAAGDGPAPSRNIIERVIGVLDKSLFESTILNEIGLLVDVLDDYQKILFSILDMLSKVIDFDLGIALLLEDEEREYFVFVKGGVDDRFIEAAKEAAGRFVLDEGRLGSLPEESVSHLRDPDNRRQEAGAAAAIGSHYFRLLTTKGHPSGAIGLFSLKERAFGERIAHTYGILANQVNMVVDYARLYERNKQLSITDGLTKVYNHRYFQETLKREFAGSIRHKRNLALTILDIDHFKKFNDTYGHQQGDVVLAELARVLKRGVRSEDTISRYGGEEFTVLMPDTTMADALRVAERLRKAVEVNDFPGATRPLKVTASFGVAAIPHELICNPAQLLAAADQALYQAKRNGRNRVEKAGGAGA